MKEQRERLRQALKKLAFIKKGEVARGGLLKDISSGGAAFEFVNPMGTVEHPFLKSDDIEIIIDGFEPLNGQVVRTIEKGIFVSFNLDADGEDELISGIMIALNDMDISN